MKKVNIIVILLVYVVFGIYFINYPFQFLEIPKLISGFDSFIIFIGGILILVGGINYVRLLRKSV